MHSSPSPLGDLEWGWATMERRCCSPTSANRAAPSTAIRGWPPLMSPAPKFSRPHGLPLVISAAWRSLIPLVPLLPGQSASALVEGTDNPVGSGPNPPPCPVDSGLLVTAPNTTHSVHLPAGPALCSGLQIHPVVPGTSGDETG